MFFRCWTSHHQFVLSELVIANGTTPSLMHLSVASRILPSHLACQLCITCICASQLHFCFHLPYKTNPPPSSNYNINFSYQWKQTPRVNVSTKQRQPLTLLPNKYNFPVKMGIQCIYMDGSFTPPTKNAEGHIIGNIAGS